MRMQQHDDQAQLNGMHTVLRSVGACFDGQSLQNTFVNCK
ncbi:hypothetical protein C8D86_1166 [Aquicella lusitana]|uniref:Uncharacterized protein n=1 Tax=Aquicella lusitana TaxID=254246 RepID=A0A370GE32_9COXI|nr:hypothetical protein C8D86_1166 [Aquicella lusitana]